MPEWKGFAEQRLFVLSRIRPLAKYAHVGATLPAALPGTTARPLSLLYASQQHHCWQHEGAVQIAWRFFLPWNSSPNILREAFEGRFFLDGSRMFQVERLTFCWWVHVHELLSNWFHGQILFEPAGQQICILAAMIFLSRHEAKDSHYDD